MISSRTFGATLGPLLVALSVGCGDGSAELGSSTTDDAGSTTTSSSSTPGTSSTTTTPSPSSSSSEESTSGANTSGTSTGPDETTTGDDETGDTWLTSSGCGFVCPPAPPPAAVSCSIRLQDCSEGGKCSPWANDGGYLWNAARCTPIDPNFASLGEPCTWEGSSLSGIDTCDAGLWCRPGADPWKPPGTCAALCNAFDVPCGEAEVCITPGPLASIGACTTQCDPLASDCPTGHGCWPAGLTFGCHPAASPKPDPSTCTGDSECPVGQLCRGADVVQGCEADRCCTPYCDLTDPQCPNDQVCEDYGSPLSAHANVGSCVAPS